MYISRAKCGLKCQKMFTGEMSINSKVFHLDKAVYFII